jgi:hypothetical protein
MNTLPFLGLLVFFVSFISGSPVSVSFPPAQCLSVSGGITITITGTSYATGNTAIVNLATVGNLTCTTTSTSTYDWSAACQTPSHAISSALDLKVWLVIGGYLWPTSFTQASLLTYQTHITDVYPSSLSLGGGTWLSVYGCFDASYGAYTYLQLGALPAIYSSSWLFVSYNTIIVVAATGGNSALSNLAVTVAWGSGPYAQLANAVNYVYPQPTSTFPSLPLPGHYLTITGTNFGESKSWWGYAQIASLPAVYSSSSNWISNTDVQIVILAPSCGEAPLTAQTLFLGWGTGSYVTLTSAVNYVYPQISSYGSIERIGSPFTFDLFGNYFGLVGNTYWSNVAVGPIGGCTPNVMSNTYITVACIACGSVTNVAVALHWYAVDYVLGPATFSIGAC